MQRISNPKKLMGYLMKKMFFLVLLISTFSTLSSCKLDNNLDAPKKFFSKNKIGSSSDYGLMKNGNDHVITIHGFVDDFSNCMEIAEMFSKKGQEKFTCSVLN